MRIQMIESADYPHSPARVAHYPAGFEFNVPRHVAKSLIESGKARPADADATAKQE